MKFRRTRKEAPDVFSFQWHITEECDQRCKHCYIYAADRNLVPDTMSWEDIVETLDRCQDFCEALDLTPAFQITGGDPLIHPDFWTLAELLHKRKLPFSILGNPNHLTPEICRRLKKLGCRRYQMSIDGTEKTHDALRRPGSYQQTLARIPMLRKAHIETAIMTTVSAANIDEVPDIMAAVVAAKADIYAFARYCPNLPGETNGIKPLRYRQLLKDCHRNAEFYRLNGSKTWFARKDHLWMLHDYEARLITLPEDQDKDIISDGCNCGVNHLTIRPNGDIWACRRVPESRVGNILEDDLALIWSENMDEYRQYERFEKCASCELMAWCRGCPAVAKSTGGSFYSPDPQCWKQ